MRTAVRASSREWTSPGARSTCAACDGTAPICSCATPCAAESAKYSEGKLRQLDHAPDACVDVVRAPDLFEVREGRFARAVTGGESLDMPGIVQGRCDFGDLLVGRGGHVEPAEHQIHSRVDSSGSLDDLLDARVRAARHEHDALRSLQGERQLAQL